MPTESGHCSPGSSGKQPLMGVRSKDPQPQSFAVYEAANPGAQQLSAVWRAVQFWCQASKWQRARYTPGWAAVPVNHGQPSRPVSYV